MTSGIALVRGDALETLRRLPSNTFHAMITDPPGGIEFMAKKWDSDKGGREKWIAWLAEIFKEAYRVLRPGAQCLVWAIPRTSHWTATALDVAGFEVYDRIHHVFGSGMPHAKDASKAIDEKLLRAEFVRRIGRKPTRAELGKLLKAARPIFATYRAGGNAGLSTEEKGGTYGVGVGTTDAVELARTTGATPEAREWDGWASNLKPGCEDWWIAQKPWDGSLAENLLKWGCGALNIDAARVGNKWEEEPDRPESWRQSGHSAQPEAEKIAAPPGIGIVLHPGGRWPANFVLTHSAGCEVVGTREAKRNYHEPPNDDAMGPGRAGATFNRVAHAGVETVPVYECTEDCPVGQMDEQVGDTSSSIGKPRAAAAPGDGWGMTKTGTEYSDSGGVSRYFNVFYATKAPRAEREAGLEEAGLPVRSGAEATGRKEGQAGVDRPQAGAGRGGNVRNVHPTVKNGKLMRMLVRLGCPVGGLVVDPFVGSGSTAIACVKEGMGCVGIDEDAAGGNYIEIAKARVAYAQKEKDDGQ